MAASHFFTKSACVGYSVASCDVVNGTVVPKIAHKTPAPTAELDDVVAWPTGWLGAGALPGCPMPDSLDTAAATCGVRMPPSALPLASVTNPVLLEFTSSRGDCGGGLPYGPSC